MVPNLRFKNFNDNWCKYSILDLGTMNRGISKHRPRDDEKLYGGEYPFIQTSNVKNSNLFITDFDKTYSDIGLKQSKLWKKGTLCITIAANIADTALLGIDACFPDSIIGWNSNNLTSNLFIKYYFDFYKNSLIKLSVGGAQDNLNLDKLKKLKLSIPSLPEQEKIKLFLQKLDERIETQSKIIKDLKIQKAKIRQTEILNVSTNKILVLNQLCNIKTGKKDANQMKSNGTYKFFTCSREDYYIDTYSFEGDSLIISGNGEIGLIKYYSGKFDAYQRTYVLQNFECDPLYLKLVLEEKLPKIINKEKNVGAMPYIVLSTLSNITIPLPDLQTQTKIQINVGILDKKIKIESQLLNKFEIQKKFLLNNMFI